MLENGSKLRENNKENIKNNKRENANMNDTLLLKAKKYEKERKVGRRKFGMTKTTGKVD